MYNNAINTKVIAIITINDNRRYSVIHTQFFPHILSVNKIKLKSKKKTLKSKFDIIKQMRSIKWKNELFSLILKTLLRKQTHQITCLFLLNMVLSKADMCF